MKPHIILLGTMVAIALTACSNTNKPISVATTTAAPVTEVQKPQETIKTTADYDSLAVHTMLSVSEMMHTCQEQIINAGDLPDGNLPNVKDLVLAKINTIDYNFKQIDYVPEERKDIHETVTKAVNSARDYKNDVTSYQNTANERNKLNEKLKSTLLQVETYSTKRKMIQQQEIDKMKKDPLYVPK